ncbi:MAG: type restriction enzyme subunit [Verrucomicrobiota bacterium]|jgi:type I restriction enzyme S subunit
MEAPSPKLRFPAFKEGWKEARLAKFFRSSRAKGEEGMPMLSVTLSRGLINRSEIERKTETNLGANEHLLVHEGDIAYNMMRMWQGAFGRSDRDGIVSPAYVVLRPQTTADSGYFEYAFRRARSIYLFWAYSYGITNDRLRLYANDFLRIPFSAPSLPEQRKIADFLTAVDGRIGQLSQKKALLEDYKKGVMQQLFTQALRFKDDHGNDFPEWEEKKLGAVSRILKGKGISKTDVAEDGATPCIRYGELYTVYSELIQETKSRTNVAEKELVLSEENDVIIPASGETHIDIATASCVMTQGIALGGDLNIIRTKLNGVFLAYYLNNACKHAIARVAQGSSVIHLYPDQLKGLSLRFPSAAEQTKIANFLTALDRKIESVSQQITHTQTFKKGLLQQMFV